jgi:hypothetical protein
VLDHLLNIPVPVVAALALLLGLLSVLYLRVRLARQSLSRAIDALGPEDLFVGLENGLLGVATREDRKAHERWMQSRHIRTGQAARALPTALHKRIRNVS